MKNFANGQAHDRNRNPVPRLVGFISFVGTHLCTPRIGRDSGHLFGLQPIERLERQPWRITSRITIPRLAASMASICPGAHQQIIAAAALPRQNDARRDRAFHW